MKHEERVSQMMQELNIPREKAEENVYMFYWMERESEFLHSIYPKFKKDFDTDIPFVGMCYALWNDESTGIRKENYLSLN